MTGEEVGTIFVLVFGVIISMMCGMAGGTIIVPITILMMNFNAKQATTLSNAIVFLAAGAKYVLSLFKKDPKAPFKTIVDYNAAIAMIPTITIFSSIGAMLATFIPDVLVMLLMVTIVIVAIGVGWIEMKHMAKHHQEEHDRKVLLQKSMLAPNLIYERKPLGAAKETKHAESAPILVVNHGTTSHTPPVQSPDQVAIKIRSADYRDLHTDSPESGNKPNEHRDPEIERQMKIDGSHFVNKKYPLILAVVVIVILATLFRGGREVNSIIGVGRCSAGDWGIFAAYIAALLLILVGVYYVIKQEQQIRKSIGYKKVDPGRLTINKRRFWMKVIGSSVISLVTTITGLGAGILLTPFFIYMNYSIVTASWTVNLIVFISKVPAIITAILSGSFLTQYVFFYGGIIAVTMLIAENSLLLLLKKIKSQEVLMVGFEAILIVSLVLNLYVGINEWVTKERSGVSPWVFASYC